MVACAMGQYSASVNYFKAGIILSKEAFFFSRKCLRQFHFVPVNWFLCVFREIFFWEDHIKILFLFSVKKGRYTLVSKEKNDNKQSSL